MKLLLMLWVSILLASLGISPKSRSDEEVLVDGDLALSEVTDALALHMNAHRDTYVLVKPDLKEKVPEPGMLIYKNQVKLDWTTGQHAHSLVENLRLGIYELGAQKPEELDSLALDHGKRIWSEVRSTYCREYPGARYFDLAWREQYCEEK
jgi:hypothetical protein